MIISTDLVTGFGASFITGVLSSYLFLREKIIRHEGKMDLMNIQLENLEKIQINQAELLQKILESNNSNSTELAVLKQLITQKQHRNV